MAINRAIAYQNLATMLDAGIPIERSFRTAASGLKAQHRNVFNAIADDILAGSGLAEALSKHTNVFAPLDITVIKVADTSGNLPESLKQLSQWYEFCNRLRHLFMSAMMLPLALIHIVALIGPLPRRFLGQIDNTTFVLEVVATLAAFYVPAVLIFAIYILTPSTGPIRKGLDTLTLRIPLLGLALRHLALTRYCRAFCMLYKAGLPIVECAKQAPHAAGNVVIAGFLKGGYDTGRAGRPIGDGFSSELPPDFLDLWRIGEETGQLDDVTSRLADTQADTAHQLAIEFCRWLPRLIYCLVSAFIVIQILRSAAAIGT